MVDQSASNQEEFGYGQQDPNTSSSELNAVAFLVSQMIGRLETMKLVKVMKVTAGTGDGDVKAAGTVDVQPLVSQIDGNGNGTPHGTVYGIPWSRAQGGKNAVVCDPVAGDIGYVVVSDRDISKVKNTRDVALPDSRRQFSLADGVYVGGVLNLAPEQYLVFTEDGIRIVDKTGNKIEWTSAGITLTPSGALPVKVVGNVIITGNLQLGGNIVAEDGSLYPGNMHIGGTLTADTDVIADGISGKNHAHQYDRPTGPSTPAQTNPPT